MHACARKNPNNDQSTRSFSIDNNLQPLLSRRFAPRYFRTLHSFFFPFFLFCFFFSFFSLQQPIDASELSVIPPRFRRANNNSGFVPVKSKLLASIAVLDELTQPHQGIRSASMILTQDSNNRPYISRSLALIATSAFENAFNTTRQKYQPSLLMCFFSSSVICCNDSAARRFRLFCSQFGDDPADESCCGEPPFKCI